MPSRSKLPDHAGDYVDDGDCYRLATWTGRSVVGMPATVLGIVAVIVSNAALRRPASLVASLLVALVVGMTWRVLGRVEVELCRSTVRVSGLLRGMTIPAGAIRRISTQPMFVAGPRPLRAVSISTASPRAIRLWMCVPGGLVKDNFEAHRQATLWREFAKRNGVPCDVAEGDLV